MADVRVNGVRAAIYQDEADLEKLRHKLEQLAERNQCILTTLHLNEKELDIDQEQPFKVKIMALDVIHAKLETPQQLAFEALQVAQDMADLLIFDIKVATLSLWGNTQDQGKDLETLLEDCTMFLSLAAKPVDVLGQDPREVEEPIKQCLMRLDSIADHLEDAVLLSVNQKNQDACHVLVGRVLPQIQNWLSHSKPFAEFLNIDRVKSHPIELGSVHPA